MRKGTCAIVLICLLFMVSADLAAVEWKGKMGLGLRGPLTSPYDDRWGPEPYQMGWNVGLDLKYGLSKSFVVDLSGSYAISYDDSTATKDQNMKLANKDNAYSKLNGILMSLTGQYYFMPEKKVQPYLLAGLAFDNWTITTLGDRGTIAKDTKYSFSDLGGKGGVGVNFWINENFAIDVQGSIVYGLTNISGDTHPIYDFAKWDNRPFRGHFEPSVGLTYFFGKPKDTDKDGVPDRKDKCPDTPLGAVVDKDGCPIDSDGDGVPDGIDKCPNTPKGCLVDATGCELDTDKDGICDGLDKCANTPKGCIVDATGCPLDADKDGVCDGLDKCPNTIKGCLVDASGCVLDGDKDGVCDGLDKCPTTPPGVLVDPNGCPVTVKPPVKKITLNIKYKTGSYEPDQNAKQVLDQLVETMKAYTGTKIEIDGFTDNVGSDASNMVLSQKRAEGVMEYLKSHGVEAERMTAKGFGEDPKFFIGDNKTAEGRQQNRRVEMISTGL